MRVENIMIEDVMTVSENDTVETCAKILTTHNLSGLPVIDDEDYLKGIITEGDLIKHNSSVQVPAFLEILGGIIYLDDPNKYLENVKKSMGHFTKTVMTKEVITVKKDEQIENAAAIMSRKKIKRLPVVNDAGQLIGIVARKDIMDYLFNKEE